MAKIVCDVDILTANYNNGAYIETFIESVINSTVQPTRLIIVDDCSKDDSLKIINRYTDLYDFITVIALEKNLGFANALNVGIENLKSKYTLRIDPDDFMSPDRIEVQYKYLIENPDVGIVGSNIQYFDSKSTKMLFKSNVALTSQKIIAHFKDGSCGLIHGSTMIETALLKRFRYCQASVPAEDYEIFSKMLVCGAIAHNQKEVLTFVRVHVDSISNFLPYATIARSYALAKEIWGVRHSEFAIRIKHLHLKYYRLFLFEPLRFKKLSYLIMASIFAPQKVLMRIIKR